MAALGHTVDTDGITGDYASLNALEAAQGQDLTDGGGDTYTATCQDTTNVADTTGVTIDGWTTAVANYIEVVNADSHGGKWNATVFRFETSVGGDTNIHWINEDYVRIEGIQYTNDTENNANMIVVFSSAGASSDIRFNKCIMKATDQINTAIIQAAECTMNVFNCIIYDIDKDGGDHRAGIRIQHADAIAHLYNNTIVDCYRGIYDSSGNCDVDMNLVSDCTDCFNGTFNSGEENAYTEGADPANNGNSVTRGVDFAFMDYAGNDFHIDASFDGTTDQSGGLVTDDIDGDARSGTYDIGADEYIAAGGETHQLAGAISIASMLSGDINVKRSLLGAVNGTTALSALLQRTTRVTGSCDGVSNISGRAYVKRACLGIIDAVSSLSGSLNIKRTFSGVIEAVSSFVGSLTLKVTASLGGIINAVSTLGGSTISIKKRMIGSMASAAVLSGNVTLTKGVTGLIEAVSSFAGSTEIKKAFVGTINIESGLVGNIQVERSIAGIIEAVSTLSGSLTFKGEAVWVHLDGIVFYAE